MHPPNLPPGAAVPISRRAGNVVETDIVSDILQRLVAYHHLCPAEVVARIEQEVRRDWGGERPYVYNFADGTQLAPSIYRTQRDRTIIEELRRGERFELLARRHGISIRRIRQIAASSKVKSIA